MVKKAIRALVSGSVQIFIKCRLRFCRKLSMNENSVLLNKKHEKKIICCYKEEKSGGKKKKDMVNDLSIIVPLYNVESFVDKLIMSLVDQKTQYKYEIILVNDGSKDRTAELIRKYLKKYRRRIVYIEKENGGTSSARNVGFEIAKGRYIGFVDADDYIDDYYVEKLLNVAYENNADIVKCGASNVKDGEIVSRDCHSDETIKGKMNSKILEYPSYVWAGVFKYEFIENVRFPESYWYEDMMVRFLLYRRSEIFINIAEPLYYRVSHSNQITKMKMTKKDYKCLDHLYLVEQLVEENKKNGLDDDVWLYLNVLLECSTIMVNRIDKLDEEIKKQVFLRAKRLVSGLYRKNYELYLKGGWKIKSDVFLKGRYDLWKMEKWL